MKAVIVAAGRSSRLYPLTLNTPKPLLCVNGKSIVERSISNLRQNGIDEIGVVVGYLREQFFEVLKDKVEFIDNPQYDITNNMASLWHAKDFVGGDEFIYLHADIVYHPIILKNCLECVEDIIFMVDKKKCDKEDMKVKVSDNLFVESSKDIPLDEAYGEWIGIAKFSSKGGQALFDEMDKVMADGDIEVYDTHAFTRLAEQGRQMNICHTNELPWVEIDFAEELEKAKKICLSIEEKRGQK
ncbi:MAG: phosphocholine cytidylyltransferase family protein [Candidatus Omnitrophota bacterium]